VKRALKQGEEDTFDERGSITEFGPGIHSCRSKRKEEKKFGLPLGASRDVLDAKHGGPGEQMSGSGIQRLDSQNGEMGHPVSNRVAAEVLLRWSEHTLGCGWIQMVGDRRKLVGKGRKEGKGGKEKRLFRGNGGKTGFPLDLKCLLT